MTHTSPTHRLNRPRSRARRAAFLVAGSVAVLGACKDSNIPFYTAPTGVAPTPGGVQNALTGLLGAYRNDMGTVAITVSAGYARDGAVFTNTEPRTVEYPLGVYNTPPSSGAIWNQEYQNIRQAQQILAAIPNTAPAYSNDQVAALDGVVQTMQAYAYMVMAEAHDTNGFAILPVGLATTQNGTAVCMKDAWKYVVALLDSANTNLVTAGATAPPVTLPNGMKGVGLSSGPGKVAGSFASFNRALAVKANLELAYAIARSPGGGAPTPTTPGSPDAATLARALALLDSTAMFDAGGALLAPTTAGGFSASATTVTHDFSGASGDVVNPIQGQIGTEAQLNDFVAAVDTANDLRFKAKFIINPNPVQQQVYNPTANECCIGGKAYSWLYYMSPSPGSSIPIIRSEGVTLYAAQIHLGMGDYVGALALVNQVRTTVGGLVPYPAADATVGNPYVQVRNDLMKEQRISMTWEASADRTISDPHVRLGCGGGHDLVARGSKRDDGRRAHHCQPHPAGRAQRTWWVMDDYVQLASRM